MAVYNGGTLLRETIESILNQTFCDFEFIIVDDGSTDETVEIIRSYADPRIRLIQPGRLANQSKCLDIGIKQARASWIARIDADDPAHPQRLELMWQVISKAEGYGVVASDVKIIYGQTRAQWQPVGTEVPVLRDVTRRLLWHNPIAHSSVFIRRSAYEQAGGFDPALDLMNDYWMWAKISKAGWRLGYVPLKLQGKRIHLGQHYENKRRLRYLLASAEVQLWVAKELFGLPSALMWPVALARIAYGLLPQTLRARIRSYV